MLTGTLFHIANICGGILLGLAMLDKWDGESNFFNNIAKYLAPFQTTIGGAMLGFGILRILEGKTLLFSIAGILGGILLLTHVLAKIPSVGDSLRSLSDKLAPFKAIIGIAALVAGIMGLLG